jgi:multiple sugar transport system permease protein
MGQVADAIWGKGIVYALIVAALVVYLIPLYWIASTSFKQSRDIFSNPPKFSFTPTADNYKKMLFVTDSTTGQVKGTTDFPRQLLNSVIVGGLSTLFAVTLGAMGAYACARFKVKAKGDLLFFILSTRMMPPVVVAIPIFLMYRALGLLDTYTGLTLLYTVFNVSFATWLMKGFFDEIPHEYEDAALLDRYSRFQAFRKVTLPQAMTGIAATAVFCLLTSWNEFAFALFLTTKNVRTAPPGITSALGVGGIEWGQIASGTMLFLLPVAVFTFLMRNYLLRGVTFGAIKK